MNKILRNMTGMGGMTDQVIATDFLNTAKSGVRNLSMAITESATPELRTAFRQQLNSAIETHGKISQYMISKGYYHPHRLDEQLQVDINMSETAMNLTQQQ
ncbi:spore coat protein [Bacillus canaveralius]|uniref:Spore coat protein n=1 Tax=Bacillus canaveralius TaxID=1403243 RepID=A0A2N5GKD4_9BACI|nr:spore coat protein [Bacillus canaveralius]PLR81974.1 spore coat protein [Bacillus canaveralius]PLR99360.1 spore coat protein [Bacillus canaveralius]RSK46919.1 spore coat protein [Bacillus canaveralius]